MPDETPLRAALYTRVSTQEQVAQGYSLGEQADKLRRYAAAMQYAVVDLYADEGYSGATLARPQMERLIDDVRRNMIDVVVVYKLDRLSRRVKDVLDLVDLLAEHKVTLFSLSENIDLSSPFGRAALKMTATFSELERDTITERMTMGRMARVKSGKYICPGRPPFGFRYDKAMRQLVPVPYELEIVKEMYRLYIAGHSFRNIYYICKERHPDVNFLHKNIMCVKEVIRRPLYAGYFIYLGELYKCTNVAPIIDYGTWLQANRVRMSKVKYDVRMNSPYLLTGLVVCARCGAHYVAKIYDQKSCGKKYRYVRYGCGARVKYDVHTYDHKCDNSIYKQQELEEIVVTAIRNLTFDAFKDSAAPSVIDRLLDENAELFKKKEKLLDLYMDGRITKDSYVTRNSDYETQITRNNTVIETESSKPPVNDYETVEFLKSQIEQWDTLDIPARRRLLQLMIDHITIDGDNIDIHWRVK